MSEKNFLDMIKNPEKYRTSNSGRKDKECENCK